MDTPMPPTIPVEKHWYGPSPVAGPTSYDIVDHTVNGSAGTCSICYLMDSSQVTTPVELEYTGACTSTCPCKYPPSSPTGSEQMSPPSSVNTASPTSPEFPLTDMSWGCQQAAGAGCSYYNGIDNPTLLHQYSFRIPDVAYIQPKEILAPTEELSVNPSQDHSTNNPFIIPVSPTPHSRGSREYPQGVTVNVPLIEPLPAIPHSEWMVEPFPTNVASPVQQLMTPFNYSPSTSSSFTEPRIDQFNPVMSYIPLPNSFCEPPPLWRFDGGYAELSSAPTKVQPSWPPAPPLLPKTHLESSTNRQDRIIGGIVDRSASCPSTAGSVRTKGQSKERRQEKEARQSRRRETKKSKRARVASS